MKFVVKSESKTINIFWFILFFLLFIITTIQVNEVVKLNKVELFTYVLLFLAVSLPIFSFLNRKTGEGIMEWTLSESSLAMKWIKRDILTDNEVVNLDWKEIDRIKSKAITSIRFGRELGESLPVTTLCGKRIKIRHLKKNKDDFFAFKTNLYSYHKKNSK
jgi:hypothetical protein